MIDPAARVGVSNSERLNNSEDDSEITGGGNVMALKKLKRLNFHSNLNDELVDQVFGESVRKEARKLLQTTAFQQKINRLFQTGDMTSDCLAKRMTKEPKVKHDYQIAVTKGIDAVADPCEELQEFMRHAVNIPASLDRELIELGAHVFLTRFNPITFFSYGWPCAGLQGASVGIAAAAWMTNQPETPMSLMDNIKREEAYPRLVARFMETFRWFGEVAQPGASLPYSKPFQANCRVRIIHSHVRNHIKVDENDWNFDPPLGWDTSELGSPLSAAEGSIVVTTLATAILLAKRKLSLQVTDREMDALFQFTSYLNYMQGVPEELLFSNADETALHFSAYIMTMDPDSYYESVKALYYGIQHMDLEKAMFPDSKVAQKLLGGILLASWEEIYGKQHQQYYETQKSPLWAITAFNGIKAASKAVNMVSRYSPAIHQRLNESGLTLWNDIFPQAQVKMKKHYNSVAPGVD